MNVKVFHLGVDSTDSATFGMCTTYLGARLLEELARLGLHAASAPELVRLNPNVPWKTRGNGAVHLTFLATEEQAGEAFRTAERLVDHMAVLKDPQTNPGLVLVGGSIPACVRELYHHALHRIVPLEEALEVATATRARIRGWKNKRGIIGALASLGAEYRSGYTREVIAYRMPERYGTKRDVDPQSVATASQRHPLTFFNIDGKGKLLCVPRSPCPVLYGIRGTVVRDTLQAAAEVRCEEVERWVLWRTNQHTDAHIEPARAVRDLRPYSSVLLRGTVASPPSYDRGGHLYFTLSDPAGERIACAAYRQTLSFRTALSLLCPGDEVSIWGAVRPAEGNHPQVINLEKVKVERCVAVYEVRNPLCPRCGGRMESLGKGKGQRCKKCRFKRRQVLRERRPVERQIGPGFIEPDPEAWRHLYRPVNLPCAEESPYEGPFWGFGKPPASFRAQTGA